MKCKNCGAELGLQDKFCSYCGCECKKSNETINSGTKQGPAFVVYEAIVFSVKGGKNNSVPGRAVQNLHVGDAVTFAKKRYTIIAIEMYGDPYCTSVDAQKICALILDGSIDQKTIKKELKACKEKNKYALFNFAD